MIFALISIIVSSCKTRKLMTNIKDSSSNLNNEYWNTLISDNNSILYSNSLDNQFIESEKILFAQNCQVCHGKNGIGLSGPNLNDSILKYGNTESDIARAIIIGIPQKGMKSWGNEFNPKEVSELIAYLRSINKYIKSDN